METHNHTGYTSDRGSPAWKHTFTQEDIQALWERTYMPTHGPRLGPGFWEVEDNTILKSE